MIRQILNYIFIIFLMHTCLKVNGNRIRNWNKVEDHINAEGHDSKIDHEAFLGLDESKKYENLTDEESKIRLRKLIKTKVDTNGDEIVTEDELKMWIKHISLAMKEKERDKMFSSLTNSPDGLLDYDSYLNGTYGPINVNDLDTVSKENLVKIKRQDIRKWNAVDENKDNKLNKNEFLVFLHPEDYQEMKWLVVQEALEISDKDNDSHLDLSEYINDIWPPNEDSERPNDEMIRGEQENFKNQHDTNQDGKLDKAEIGEWLMPSNHDGADAETQHLIQHADTDKDGQLSMTEIIESHDIFVGSQVTDYGNSLKHDEL